jgi:hypothetical protein
MRFFLFIFFTFAFLVSIHAQDAIKKVIVETYYVSDSKDAAVTTGGNLEAGSKTYRIYIQMKPKCKLRALFGDQSNPMIIKSTANFFNNSDRDFSFGNQFSVSNLEENTVALDTWLTIGQTTKSGSKTYFGVIKADDKDGSIIGGQNNDVGILVNADPLAGITITTADGMETSMNVPTNWVNSGFIDPSSGVDNTIFGAAKPQSEFKSHQALLGNSGVMGLDPENNTVLVAQLTTKGEISFELNVQIEDSTNRVINYIASGVSTGDTVLFPELKYPAECGCKDPNYFEFDNRYACDKPGACITPIVYGCMDPNACNYDPNANYNMLCCYPGDCNQRDISLVCPNLNVNQAAIQAYPNPMGKTLALRFSNVATQNVRVSIHNIYGKKFYEENLNVYDANIHELNVANLSKGFYLLHVSNNEGLSVTQYLIKN